MNPETGSFISLDTYQGNAYDPASLHKYNYAQNNPQMYKDPSGNFAILADNWASSSISAVLNNRVSICIGAVINGAVSGVISALAGDSGIQIVQEVCKGMFWGAVGCVMGDYYTSEVNAAQYMADLGNDVVLRLPVGTRVSGGTYWRA